MLRTLFSLFRRPPVRMGRVDNSRMRTTRIRNAQFVSFFSSNDCVARRHPDRHDQRLRRQKFTKSLITAGAATGLAWIAIESAKAISIF